ncbi:MAG TPA: T9SS type A sorting domain-containing protein, partial [Ignavibacteriaceae bacterium]|nr:T9SS type A sorting domain-containing protein [Ignavibacteriaceae bacterium]
KVLTSMDEENDALPKEFSLLQNYPNPFNPITNIRFQIPRHCLVTLKIFDVLGRQVAVLVNEEKSPGIYHLSYDASALASGVYYYQLTADNFIQVKKMQVIK